MNENDTQPQQDQASQEYNSNLGEDLKETAFPPTAERPKDKRTIIAIVLLILIYPVGWLYALVATKWPVWVKLALTALLLLPLAIILIFSYVLVFPVPQDRVELARLNSEANKKCLAFYDCVSKEDNLAGCNSVEKIFTNNSKLSTGPEIDVKVETKGSVVRVVTSIKSEKIGECEYSCGYDFDAKKDIEIVMVDPSKCL